jgi:predicted amidophosphoribosyltransferase
METIKKYCSNCGNQVEIKDKFCPSCKAKFVLPDRSIKYFKKYLVGTLILLPITILMFYFLPYLKFYQEI